MKLVLTRYSSTDEDTLGHLKADDKLIAYTLEDEFRTIKVFAATRIPAGSYKLKLREHGGFYTRYTKRWSWHKGMIELVGVPNFTDVLIHLGNSDDDTAGCILVGNMVKVNTIDPGEINLLNSTDAYRRIYPLISEAIEQDEVILEIIDVG